jgi:monoamine oxidase
VKRRKALKHLGFGISAGLALPAWLSACKDDETGPEISYDGVVGIVGAGAAGLYAADILDAKGIKVVLFEASGRAGGRVRSLRSFDTPSDALLFDPETPLSSDFPTELGADRIQGTDSLLTKLVNQQNVSTVDLSTATGDVYFLDGNLADNTIAQADSDFVAAKNFLDNLASYSGGNVSAEQAIQSAGINPRVFAILNSWIGNKWGTSNSRLGIKALAEGLALLERNKNELILSDNPMQDVLLSRFTRAVQKVELNTVVKSINYGAEKISVSGTKGAEPFSVEVDKLIVTVPLSILKSGAIAFNPALPSAKSTAISRMGMDSSIRVFLDFKQNFWGNSTRYIHGGAKAPEYFNTGFGRSQFSKTLSVTINGPRAEELSPLGKDMIPVLLGELDTVYDGMATENVRRDQNDNIISVIQDWSKEPYILGAASYVIPGGTNEDRTNLATAISERLFFAGEATDDKGEAGTVNGALLSGERAAQEVIDAIIG